MPDWIAPIGAAAAILLLVGAGVWAGRVVERLRNLKETADADRNAFLKRADAERDAFLKRADADRQALKETADTDRNAFQKRADAERDAFLKRADADRDEFQKRADADRQALKETADAFLKRADADRNHFQKRADADRNHFQKRADADRDAFLKRADADRAAFEKSAAEDRKRFREVVDEIREDIKRIFRRLPPVAVAERSPLGLTNLGHAISKDVEGVAWAIRTAPGLEERIRGMEAFEIQRLCFDHVAEPTSFGDAMTKAIQKCAYERGLKEEQVLRVLAIELRDKLLELAGMAVPA